MLRLYEANCVCGGELRLDSQLALDEQLIDDEKHGSKPLGASNCRFSTVLIRPPIDVVVIGVDHASNIACRTTTTMPFRDYCTPESARSRQCVPIRISAAALNRTVRFGAGDGAHVGNGDMHSVRWVSLVLGCACRKHSQARRLASRVLHALETAAKSVIHTEHARSDRRGHCPEASSGVCRCQVSAFGNVISHFRTLGRISFTSQSDRDTGYQRLSCTRITT